LAADIFEALAAAHAGDSKQYINKYFHKMPFVNVYVELYNK